MKNILLAVVFVFIANFAFAQATNTSTDNGEAKAKIVEALVLEHDDSTSLDFGTLIKPTSGGGTAVVNASTGAISYTGSVKGVAGNTGTRDRFTVSNVTSGVTYAISLPASITIQSGSDSMTVNNLQHNCTSTCSASEFLVGGTLNVSENQAVGTYQANYPVTITY